MKSIAVEIEIALIERINGLNEQYREEMRHVDILSKICNELRAENKRLTDGFIEVSYMDSEEIIISNIHGYDFETVKGAKDYLQQTIEELNPRFGENDIFANYEITNLKYQAAQIGNYPPPNVEMPGYWDFDIKFIGMETIEDMQ